MTKPPYEALLDLVQDHYANYFNDLEPVQFWMAGRPRLPNELIPSIYCFPDNNIVEQRTIPENKTTLERFSIKLSYYTTNKDILFNIQQVIKQIVVSNNKVQNTSQIKNTGIQWLQIKRFDFDYLQVSEEHIIFNVVASIEVVYQENYL